MADTIGYTDFSAKIKAKHPEYSSVDDRVLAEKFIEKYPTYKEQVVFDSAPANESTLMGRFEASGQRANANIERAAKRANDWDQKYNTEGHLADRAIANTAAFGEALFQNAGEAARGTVDLGLTGIVKSAKAAGRAAGNIPYIGGAAKGLGGLLARGGKSAVSSAAKIPGVVPAVRGAADLVSDVMQGREEIKKTDPDFIANTDAINNISSIFGTLGATGAAKKLVGNYAEKAAPGIIKNAAIALGKTRSLLPKAFAVPAVEAIKETPTSSVVPRNAPKDVSDAFARSNRGLTKVVTGVASELSGPSKEALTMASTKTGRDALKDAAGSQGKIAEEVLDLVDNWTQRIPEHAEIKSALENMPEIDIGPTINALENGTAFTEGTEGRAKANAVISDLIDRMKTAAENYSGGSTLPASVMYDIRKQYDDILSAAYNKGEKTYVESAAMSARRAMKDSLIDSAKKSGNDQYVSSMETLAQKMDAIDRAKKVLGNNPTWREQNSQSIIDNLFNRNKDKKQEILDDLEKVFGADFMEQARSASLAKQFGANGDATFLPTQTTGRATLGASLLAGGAAGGGAISHIPVVGMAAPALAPAVAILASTVGASLASPKIATRVAIPAARAVDKIHSIPAVKVLEKAALDAGAGAAVGAAVSDPGKRSDGAKTGAMIGAGAGALSPAVLKALGKMRKGGSSGGGALQGGSGGVSPVGPVAPDLLDRLPARINTDGLRAPGRDPSAADAIYSPGKGPVKPVGISDRTDVPMDENVLPDPIIPFAGTISTKNQTITPEFKKWFGDSKVVNENGNPLVVYHGTNGNFNAFDTENKSAYFTPNKEYANNYGSNVFPNYLKIERPFKINWDISTGPNYDEHYMTKDRFSEEMGQINDKIGLAVSKHLQDIGPEDEIEPWAYINSDWFRKIVKDEGYDGITAIESREKIFVPLSSLQIKSSIGNRGTFDPNDANILHGSAGGVKTNNVVTGSALGGIGGYTMASTDPNATEEDKRNAMAVSATAGGLLNVRALAKIARRMGAK